MLEELILDEKNEEGAAQIEGSGTLRLTEEPNSVGWGTPQNSSDDVSNKATDETFGTAVNATALPEATVRRQRRNSGEWSCLKSSEARILPLSNTTVNYATECYSTASVHGRCTSSIKVHGKRACAKVFVMMEGLAIAVCTCA